MDRLIDAALRDMLTSEGAAQLEALERIADLHDTAAVAPLIHMLFWLGEEIHDPIVATIRSLAGEPADAPDSEAFFDWMVWLQAHTEYAPHALYDALAGDLYAALDPQFSRFLRVGITRSIRLEEIVWGGVNVDAIPALDNPATTGPEGAGWLNPDDPVLGVLIGGQARAYPLRIMYWHELVNDVVGGVPVALPFCSLCGAGILYDARVAGQSSPLKFGTSGLLYRSNKLMFDRATDSLWSQFTGEAVVGALAGNAPALTRLPLVQTDGAAWLARHPDTSVLSEQTGHLRDYAPDAAYRTYRASPDLAFPARITDTRMPAKTLVFGLHLPGGAKAWPLDSFDETAPLHATVGLHDVVIFGNARTGIRAYQAGGHRFTVNGPNLTSSDGPWRATESALIGPDGRTFARLPGHVAYWFAWAGAWGAGGE